MNARTNALLASLPESELLAISSHLELVSLQKGQTLFHIGEVPSHVYYPIGAIVSMMNDAEDGFITETFMLGNACMVGAGTVGQPSFYRACVRSSGLAYRMPAKALESLRYACPNYLQTSIAAINRMLMQLSQAVVCSKRHSVDQQLIRWILITLDRGTGDRIEITHQELSEILGFRRESVTVQLNKMAALRHIAISRGAIDIVDRTALEKRSCECYWKGIQKQRPVRSR